MLGQFFSKTPSVVSKSRKDRVAVGGVVKAELLIAILALRGDVTRSRMPKELRKYIDLPDGFLLDSANMNNLYRDATLLSLWLDAQGIKIGSK